MSGDEVRELFRLMSLRLDAMAQSMTLLEQRMKLLEEGHAGFVGSYVKNTEEFQVVLGSLNMRLAMLEEQQ